MSGNIVIHTLRCGTMRVLPRERYIADRGQLRERVELPVNVYLIEHPKHGRILLDTGWSSDCRELLPPRLLKFYEPRIGKGETMPFSPRTSPSARITCVIPSSPAMDLTGACRQNHWSFYRPCGANQSAWRCCSRMTPHPLPGSSCDIWRCSACGKDLPSKAS